MNQVQQKTRKIVAHSRPIYCGQYSIDGAYVYTASYDSYVKKYCAYTGQELQKWGPHGTTTGTAISSFSLTSDNRYIAVGLKLEKVIIHDTVLGKEQQKDVTMELEIAAKGSRFVQFSKDSKSLFVGTTNEGDESEALIIQYSFPELKQQQVYKTKQILKCCCLSSDDSQLIIGTETGLFSLKVSNFEMEFEEELGAPVCDLVIYKDAFVIVPLSSSKKVYFYSLRQGVDCYCVPVHNQVNTADVHPTLSIMTIGGGLDPKLVAKTIEGNNVLTQYYDMIGKQIILEQEVHAAPTHRIRWSPDGLGLLSVSEDGSIAIIRFGEQLMNYKWEADWTI